MSTVKSKSATSLEQIEKAIDSLAWPTMIEELSKSGFAVTEQILSQAQCLEIASWFDDKERFRSTINMEQHRFGKGVYMYFAYPLPELIAHIRTHAYPHLAACANSWNQVLNLPINYPESHKSFLDECHRAGQSRPTPLLLKYETGDYNCLHQDLYGEILFPIQMAILLSEPGRDFEGGEFVLAEQRPRAQSKIEVVPLRQGQAVIFAVNHRPVVGSRGTYRVTLRHGVSKLRRGSRFTLGIIFHDAR